RRTGSRRRGQCVAPKLQRRRPRDEAERAMSSATEVDHGRMATRPKELTKDAWLDIGSRVRRGVGRDNLSMKAAGAAFYGLFAIFPAIAALVSLYGLFTDAATVTEHMRALEGVLPEEARGVLDQQLRRVSEIGRAHV